MPSPDSQTQAQPAVKWVSQFQALVTDTPKGILGIAVDRRSEEDAKEMAFADCRSKGGTECELELAVRNGCIAMAVGTSSKAIFDGDTEQEAESRAMGRCNQHDTNCGMYYKACSLPFKIRQ